MAYILSHWRGKQSLTWSFWGNLVGLRIALYVIEWSAQSGLGALPPRGYWIMVMGWVAVQLVILVWQIVGLLRACDAYLITSHGAIEWVWTAYGGLFTVVLIAANGWFSLFVPLLPAHLAPGETAAEILERERASKYSLTIADSDAARQNGIVLNKGKRVLYLKGSFELGITQNLKALLDRQGDIKGLILESDGGRIYEARRIARMVRDRGLTTYVLHHCNSACTTAFIGGKSRVLGANGTLGFHKYWLDAQLQHPFVDLKAEQEKDRAFYRSSNITAQFLDRIFDKPHTGLWQPDHATLLKAGVVHKILPTSRDNQ